MGSYAKPTPAESIQLSSADQDAFSESCVAGGAGSEWMLNVTKYCTCMTESIVNDMTRSEWIAMMRASVSSPAAMRASFRDIPKLGSMRQACLATSLR
jgi:hypothetical protein